VLLGTPHEDYNSGSSFSSSVVVGRNSSIKLDARVGVEESTTYESVYRSFDSSIAATIQTP
jgi:hypothetical protein